METNHHKRGNMSARIASDAETLKNVFRRYVEQEAPRTFSERMAVQMRAFKEVASVRGETLSADRVEWWAALFAQVCPSK